LFVVVPVVFILGAYAITPDKPITLFLVEGGRRIAMTYSLFDLHGATMAATAIGPSPRLSACSPCSKAATATAAPPSPACARAPSSRPAW